MNYVSAEEEKEEKSKKGERDKSHPDERCGYS